MEFDIAHWLTIGIITCLAVLAYAFVVFPILMSLLGSRRRPSLARPAALPSVTLIIPAHNEEQVIDQKIRNSLALDYPNLEIVVASDGSTDQTNEIARRYESVRLLVFDQRRGKASVLNDAVASAGGELVCLCDANVILHLDAMWKLAVHFADEDVGGVTGDVRLQSHLASFGFAETLYYRFERSIQLGESSLGSVIGADGGMYMIRRELYRELPQDTVLDDFSVSMSVLRSGKKLLYEPNAIAEENTTELAMEEYRRRRRIGAGAAQLLGRGISPKWTQPCRLLLFVSHKLLRWFSPWLLVLLFVMAAILSFYRVVGLAVVIPGLVLLALALIGIVWPGARRFGLVAVCFYFALSQIAFGWGMMRGLLFGESGIWERTARRPLVDQGKA